MYDTILIATDGSDRADTAAAHGLSLAEKFGARVHALFVLNSRALTFDEEDFGNQEPIIEALSKRGKRATDQVLRMAETRGIDAESHVIHGHPAQQIRQHADELDVDLITMGTHGRSGLSKHLLGSVAQAVLRKAPQPVLTARSATARYGTEYKRILLPTDGGKQAERAAKHAFGIAAKYGATVHALSVIDSGLVQAPAVLEALEEESEQALKEAKELGRQQDVVVKTSVWKGTPADCVIAYADEKNMDLITIGAHEKKGLDRFLTKTVAERVNRQATCPVLSIR